MDEIDKDIKRNSVINELFSEKKFANNSAPVDIMSVKNDLEKDLFETLARYGYERTKVTPIVANLLQNLSRL